MLIVIGLYSVLWGKSKEKKDNEVGEKIEAVKGGELLPVIHEGHNIESNGNEAIQKKEALAISIPPMVTPNMEKKLQATNQNQIN